MTENTQDLTDEQLQKINDAVTKALEGLKAGAYDSKGNLTYDEQQDNTMYDKPNSEENGMDKTVTTVE